MLKREAGSTALPSSWEYLYRIQYERNILYLCGIVLEEVQPTLLSDGIWASRAELPLSDRAPKFVRNTVHSI